ncbi:hypothetical protein ACFQ3W_00520 [Paenibacillus puldeungensis]|uniref:Condensation domain-containing protein n=1 Tax=Paenibacillus puldeungensis TaxID=696536 RepID=A0ABW3RQQ2_9BACL
MSKQIITERTNLFEPNVYIGMYVEIDGRPPVKLLKEAIQKAFRRNELTMSKVIIDQMGRAYYQKLEQSGCKVIITDREWKKIFEENEKHPFAIKHGELMRVFVKEDGSIFFMAHHLVGDGKSIIVLLQDALKLLTGNEVQYKPANMVTEDFLHKKAKLNFMMRRYISHLNTVWKREGQYYSWDVYDAIHKKYWGGHTSNILTHTFSKLETDRIKEMARAAKVTVNSYLISSILFANKGVNEVGIAIDIRENDHSMSNQVSGIAIPCTYVTRSKIQDNAKAIHKKISKMLNSPAKKYFVLLFLAELCPTLIDAVLLAAHGQTQNKTAKKVAYALGYKGKKKRDLGVSNLGVINIQSDYGKYKINNITFVPPSVSYAEHIMGISTINERITITYHGMKEDEETSWFEFVKKHIVGGI